MFGISFSLNLMQHQRYIVTREAGNQEEMTAVSVRDKRCQDRLSRMTADFSLILALPSGLSHFTAGQQPAGRFPST